MPLNRYRQRIITAKDKEHRSKLEDQVEQALIEQGLSPEYEKDKFSYVLHRKYKPDFRVGDVYIEVKGWWPSAERTKFLAVVVNNPDLKIFVAMSSPFQKISRPARPRLAVVQPSQDLLVPNPYSTLVSTSMATRQTTHLPCRRHRRMRKAATPPS